MIDENCHSDTCARMPGPDDEKTMQLRPSTPVEVLERVCCELRHAYPKDKAMVEFSVRRFRTAPLTGKELTVTLSMLGMSIDEASPAYAEPYYSLIEHTLAMLILLQPESDKSSCRLLAFELAAALAAWGSKRAFHAPPPGDCDSHVWHMICMPLTLDYAGIVDVQTLLGNNRQLREAYLLQFRAPIVASQVFEGVGPEPPERGDLVTFEELVLQRRDRTGAAVGAPARYEVETVGGAQEFVRFEV